MKMENVLRFVGEVANSAVNPDQGKMTTVIAYINERAIVSHL